MANQNNQDNKDNQIQYQSSNILDNFYMDGLFNYIFTTSLYTHPNSFNDISGYAKIYIPQWQPVCSKDLTQSTVIPNRLIFNSGTMFEMIIHKNIIVIIPLYISNYGILENNLFHIKNYCEKLIMEEEKNNMKLIAAIGYKLYIYSTTTCHPKIQYNRSSVTSTTILNTNLHLNMYESYPFNLIDSPHIANTANTPNSTQTYITYSPNNQANQVNQPNQPNQSSQPNQYELMSGINSLTFSM